MHPIHPRFSSGCALLLLAALAVTAAPAEAAPGKRHARTLPHHAVIAADRDLVVRRRPFARPTDIVLDVPPARSDEDLLIDGSIMQLFERLSR